MSPNELPDGEPTADEPRLWRQGEEASSPFAGLLGLPVSSPRSKPFAHPGQSVQSPPDRARSKTARDVRSLFDFVSSEPAIAKPPAPEPEARPPPEPAPFIVATGEKAKAHDIINAICALKTIEQEQRAATPEERQALARFAGFGPVALSIFPDPITGRYKDASWQAIGEELKALTTPEEYDSAKRTTFNAFYTSPTVIAGMHDAISRLGVPTNGILLEPGCGTGNFVSLAPQGMRFIGIELDSISGRIAKALHPDQDIRIENFRDTRLPDESLDGVIGNVPFADLKLDYRGQRLSLHDFFFAKSIDALKPGGVLALVSTHFTLDKVNAAVREYLAAKADFVGAIRLPSDAFKREGTSVVTDIVFMRKRSLDEPPNHVDPEWIGVAPLTVEDVEVSINRYFLHHSEMVLGAWSRKDTLYGEGYSVIGNGDLAGHLRAAIQRLPQFTSQHASAAPELPAPFTMAATGLGKPFRHDAVLSELTTLRDRLKACLSEKTTEPATKPRHAFRNSPSRSKRSNPRRPLRPRLSGPVNAAFLRKSRSARASGGGWTRRLLAIAQSTPRMVDRQQG